MPPQTTKPSFRLHMRLDPEDAAIIAKIRKHAGIRSDADLIRASLRAHMREIDRLVAAQPPANIEG